MGIMIILINSFLWALGGFEHKWRRSAAIPLLNALILHSFAPLLGLLALRVGYGVNENRGEKSSFLGTFWLNHTPNFFWANVMTRFTVGILYGLSTILYYKDIRTFFAILVTTIITVLFGAIITGEPTIKIGKIQLNAEELIIGAAYGSCWLMKGAV
jgi:hypothetical protein